MKYLLILAFLQYQVLRTRSLLSDRNCGEIYPKNAKNIILVFLEIHQNLNASSSLCDKFIGTTLTDAIKIYEIIDQLSLTKNFSIGVRICDTCQNDKIAQILTTENIVYLTQTLKLQIICKQLFEYKADISY